jgi:hypothetical protein
MNDVKSGFVQSKCMTNIDVFFLLFLYLCSTFVLYLETCVHILELELADEVDICLLDVMGGQNSSQTTFSICSLRSRTKPVMIPVGSDL